MARIPQKRTAREHLRLAFDTLDVSRYRRAIESAFHARLRASDVAHAIAERPPDQHVGLVHLQAQGMEGPLGNAGRYAAQVFMSAAEALVSRDDVEPATRWAIAVAAQSSENPWLLPTVVYPLVRQARETYLRQAVEIGLPPVLVASALFEDQPESQVTQNVALLDWAVGNHPHSRGQSYLAQVVVAGVPHLRASIHQPPAALERLAAIARELATTDGAQNRSDLQRAAGLVESHRQLVVQAARRTPPDGESIFLAELGHKMAHYCEAAGDFESAAAIWERQGNPDRAELNRFVTKTLLELDPIDALRARAEDFESLGAANLLKSALDHLRRGQDQRATALER